MQAADIAIYDSDIVPVGKDQIQHIEFCQDMVGHFNARYGARGEGVEARIDNAPWRLRPGMEGVAKVDIGERRLIWIWTRSLREWIRIFFWTWAG